ncbi:unnamed protein product [Durusdinium trenchii]|uniref:PUL domain-containing protein n=1 Tax=Durusdinium trenchii TaxID=1381693 RepID=A0ABP0I9X1_9DINO
MEETDVGQLRWFLSIATLIVALIAGATALHRSSSTPKGQGKRSSRLLKEDSLEPKVSTPVVEPDIAHSQHQKEETTERSSEPLSLRFRFTPNDLLNAHLNRDPDSDPDHSHGARVWAVETTEDAAALLAGCPMDTVIACSFHRQGAEHGKAQAQALRQLARAEPAGMSFAEVDLHAAPEVAAWARVVAPEVRLLQPDGQILQRVTPREVATGALHRWASVKAGDLAKEAETKLDALAQRFPGALCDEMKMCTSKENLDKMQAAGHELLARKFSDAEVEIFQRLCDSYRAHAVPRARLVSGLAKLLRRLTTSTTAPATPLLDLSRRLAASKLLGGSEPGALEALELLLNAILNHSEAPEAPTAVMLAGQFLANCFHQPLVGEALLPVAAEALQLPTWRAVWDPSGHAKAREAVAVLLLNASVALRKARFRASHGPLLEQALAALKCLPTDERVNWAVGNLLAMGGGPDEARRALASLAPLRALAAAVVEGQLDGPEGVAFPAAWGPDGRRQHDPQRPQRPAGRPRAPVPARYRRGGG